LLKNAFPHFEQKPLVMDIRKTIQNGRNIHQFKTAGNPKTMQNGGRSQAA